MLLEEILINVKEKMTKNLILCQNELNYIFCGKIDYHIISNMLIDYCGVMTKLNKISNITSSSANTIIIKPYKNFLIKKIIEAIKKSNLELSFNINNNSIILNIPYLTEEKRKWLIKEMWKKIEIFKIIIRNERRWGNENIKKITNCTENNKKYYIDKIQKLTDSFILQINNFGKIKEKELIKF